MKILSKLSIGAFAAAAFAAAPAQAVISTPQTISGTLGAAFLLPAGFTTTLDFNPFTNPGERLTGVTLTFSTGFSTDFTVNSNVLGGSNSSRRITLNRGIEGTLSGNGFNLSDTDVVSKTINVPKRTLSNPVSFGTYDPTAAGSGSLASGFSAFTGPGPVAFSFNAKQFGNSIDGSGTLPIPNLLNSTTAFSATLNYESVVPEPATWAMLLGGFGLVGATLRRGRETHRMA